MGKEWTGRGMQYIDVLVSAIAEIESCCVCCAESMSGYMDR
jgi:hypothetical protein